MSKKKYLWFVILLLVYAIFFTTVSILGGIHTFIRLDNLNNKIDKGYIYITLQHESNPLELPNQESTLKSFKKISNSLHDSYQYYEIYRQPLDHMSISKAFYNQFDELSTTTSDAAQCIQISENVQYDFDFSVLNGRLLSASDYYHKSGKAIPVLMGSDYSKIYTLGTTFTANYLFDTYSFEVVGFLAHDSSIVLSTGSTELNRYIVLPSFDFEDTPVTELEYISQKIHNANKTSGKIKVTSAAYNQSCNDLQKIIASSEVGEYSWTTSSIEKNMSRLGINMHGIFLLLIVISIVLWISSLFLTKRYFFFWNNTNSSFGLELKKIFSLVCLLLIALMLSTQISLRFLQALGLAKNNYWGAYSGIVMLLIEIFRVWHARLPSDNKK